MWHPAGAAGGHDLYILGPAGFLRHVTHAGTSAPARPRLGLTDAGDGKAILLTIRTERPLTLEMADLAYGWPPRAITVRDVAQVRIDLAASDGWYDLELREAGAAGRLLRLAGYRDDGAPGRSDPALARG